MRDPSELRVTHCDVPIFERALSYPESYRGKVSGDSMANGRER